MRAAPPSVRERQDGPDRPRRSEPAEAAAGTIAGLTWRIQREKRAAPALAMESTEAAGPSAQDIPRPAGGQHSFLCADLDAPR